MYLCLSIVVKIRKYASVFSKQTVNIAHKVIAVPVKFVVVTVPALVRTELLIGSSPNNFAAIKASLFFHGICFYSTIRD